MEISLKHKKRFPVAYGTGLNLWVAIGLAVSVLLLSSFFYLKLSNYLKKTTSKPVELERPLAQIPMEIGQWQGKDVPISLEILKVAANDDYVNRLYAIPEKRIYANLYIAFSATPRTMLGHRPQVCYKGAGWINDQTEEKILESRSGILFPVLLHKFHKEFTEIYVLNFYILNGKITNSEKGFSGINFRTPNIDGQLARYVAQVQISGRYPSDVVFAAETFIDEIIEFFPVKKD